MTATHYDVLIIGAGLSGIGMGCHLAQKLPNKSYAVLERRDAVGGTWDLFKYPGIRSDSDMFTFGFNFRPWMGDKVLADGAAIKEYVIDTAKEYGVYEKIKFGRKLLSANWSSKQTLWTLTTENESSGETETFTCNFFVPCTGYYNYDTGFMPQYPGVEDYKGQLIHPQHWPEDLDYAGKKVVVIGSGATAVTVVPAMSEKAAKVTMLQRSPTYIISVPAVDHVAQKMQKFMPANLVFKLTRKRNIAIQNLLYRGSKRFPNFFRKLFLKGVAKQVPADQMKHFTPDYDPWDQRVCAVPNGDLFKALRQGKAEMVTDHIEKFTDNGILLKSGQTLEADIVVSATGLDLRMLGGVDITLDGEHLPHSQLVTYKAVLIENAPNIGVIFGYTNAPWTLKADIASAYLCRLMAHMDKKGYNVAIPRAPEGTAEMEQSAFEGLNSGYVKRGAPELPRQGRSLPFRILNHYKKDQKMLLRDPIEDEYLEFHNA